MHIQKKIAPLVRIRCFVFVCKDMVPIIFFIFFFFVEEKSSCPFHQEVYSVFIVDTVVENT